MIELEDLEERLNIAVNSSQYDLLLDLLKRSKFIYLIGSGGNLSVCQHAISDLKQYIPNKQFNAPSSLVSLTANIVEQQSNMLFVNWLEAKSLNLKPEECLLIALTSSGKNLMINNAILFAEQKKMNYFVISGTRSENKNTLSFNTKYYHTSELLSLSLIYNLASEFSDLKMLT